MDRTLARTLTAILAAWTVAGCAARAPFDPDAYALSQGRMTPALYETMERNRTGPPAYGATADEQAATERRLAEEHRGYSYSDDVPPAPPPPRLVPVFVPTSPVRALPRSCSTSCRRVGSSVFCDEHCY